MEIEIKNGKIVKKMSSLWHVVFGCLLGITLLMTVNSFLENGDSESFRQKAVLSFVILLFYVAKCWGDKQEN